MVAESSLPSHCLCGPEYFTLRCAAAVLAEERTRACVNCTSEDDRASMVSCGTCKKGPWHVACWDPPLEVVPQTYTCKPCHKKAVAARKKPAGSRSPFPWCCPLQQR